MLQAILDKYVLQSELILTSMRSNQKWLFYACIFLETSCGKNASYSKLVISDTCRIITPQSPYGFNARKCFSTFAVSRLPHKTWLRYAPLCAMRCTPQNSTVCQLFCTTLRWNTCASCLDIFMFLVDLCKDIVLEELTLLSHPFSRTIDASLRSVCPYFTNFDNCVAFCSIKRDILPS